MILSPHARLCPLPSALGGHGTVEKPVGHERFLEETSDWLRMKNYHTGLVARKL